MRRSLAAAVVALVAAVACTAEAPPAQQPSPPVAAADGVGADGDAGTTGRTLRVAIDEPATLVPADATTPAELVLVDALFDSLTGWGPTGEVVPRAAVRWQADADAARWTFRLRDGATFHDGTPVTAEDVRVAWEHAVASGAAGYHLRDVEGYGAVASGHAERLAGVTAVSERSLEVRLDRPNADFPAVVAHPSLAPVPADAWSSEQGAFRTMPIGNGPFAVAEPPGEGERQGGFLRAVRFDQWRNAPVPRVAATDPEPAGLAEVVFRFMDPETAYLAFQQERVDVATVPDEAVEAAIDRFGPAADGSTGPGVVAAGRPALYALGFNVTVAPFDVPDVRRAIGLAVDRAALADDRPGNRSPARAIVPAGVPGARRAPCLDCVHRPGTARSVLAEHGVTELELWTTRGAGHERVADRLRADLGSVGVRLVVRAVDFERYRSALRDGEAAFFRLGWAVDYPTAANALEPLFHSSAIPDGDLDAGHNVFRYSAGDVDALLDEARRTLDPGDRVALYQQAEDLLLNRDHAVVPLLSLVSQLVVADRVEGLTVSPIGTLGLDEVTLVEVAR